jgi:hypothetical protein
MHYHESTGRNSELHNSNPLYLLQALVDVKLVAKNEWPWRLRVDSRTGLY